MRYRFCNRLRSCDVNNSFIGSKRRIVQAGNFRAGDHLRIYNQLIAPFGNSQNVFLSMKSIAATAQKLSGLQG